MPAPYDDRLVGRDVQILTLDGTSIIAEFQSANLNFSVQTANVTSVMDSGERGRPTHYSYTVQLNKLKTIASSALPDAGARNFAQVAWQMQDASGGSTYSGYANTTGLGFNLDDGAQMDNITLTGTGNISIDGVEQEILPTA